MNKSKIEWCDYTWNPVTGCLHGCEYCYAERIAERFGQFPCENSNCVVCNDCQLEPSYTCKRYVPYKKVHELDNPVYLFNPKRLQPYPFGFEPTFHCYKLDEPKSKTKGIKIFVCSMSDLFGDWVPDEWIKQVFNSCESAPQHKYLFLTKNPKRYGEINGWNHVYDWSFAKQNMWFGITITDHNDIQKLKYLPYGKTNTFISIEPLKSSIDLSFYIPQGTTNWKCSYCGYHSNIYSNHCSFCGKAGGYSGSFRKEPINWVIIGAQTGPKAIAPKKEWVQSIIDQCRAANVPVFLKDNLNWPEKIQEYPEGLR